MTLTSLKVGRHLRPDFLFPAVNRIGSLAVLILDLTPWDSLWKMIDQLEELQEQETVFLRRLADILSGFRASMSVLLHGEEPSRRRFQNIQDRYGFSCFHPPSLKRC